MAHSIETLKRPPVNPVSGFKWNKEYARREAMPPETIPAFIAALDNIKGDSVGDLYKLLLFIELPKSEAIKLQWSDVDLDKGSLHIADTKNGEPLNIPISGFVVDLLKARKEKDRINTTMDISILGDPLYADGGRINNLPDTQLRGMINRLGRQALHARCLGFIHPSSAEYMEFTAEPPDDMQELLTYLRRETE